MGGHPQGKFFTLPFIHSLKIFPLASVDPNGGLRAHFWTRIGYPKRRKGEPRSLPVHCINRLGTLTHRDNCYRCRPKGIKRPHHHWIHQVRGQSSPH
ncbi:hypothetical protein FR934_14830 [Synechocystis sp. PCC 6803]|nr:hypothetical protein C7I86_17490 [Synechocystis sp. IPPAS B-1465]MCW5241971.1 hypothetical protein [Synechocystis sp. PCC 6803]